MFKRGVQIVNSRIGLLSNNWELITKSEYFEDIVLQSLLTDFHRILPIDYSPSMDADVFVIDERGLDPILDISENRIVALGDFSALEDRVDDRRYTLFGNQGLLYRFALVVMERYHDTYSLHASSIYHEGRDRLLIVVGGAGVGKSCLLLAGLSEGFTIFSTEMTHFQLADDRIIFYKGSLLDNVRLGSLIYDYPEVAEELGIQIPKVDDVWGFKMAVDLKDVQTPLDTLIDPRITIVFPRVEAGRKEPIVNEITSSDKLKRLLFENATEKIGTSLLLYETVPIGGLDSLSLMKRRLSAVERFVNILRPGSAKTILAGPHNCLEGV